MAQSASGVARATITTGKRSQTNSTTRAATIEVGQRDVTQHSPSGLPESFMDDDSR